MTRLMARTRTNPFSPTLGTRPARLVGREPLIQSILDGLGEDPGSRNRAVIFSGQRGSGKTALLLEIAERARRVGHVVADPTTAGEGMLDRIIEKLQEDGEAGMAHGPQACVSGAKFNTHRPSVDLSLSRETLETKSFHHKLRVLCTRLVRLGLGVLVLVDDIRANSSEVRQLVGTYLELVGEGMNVALVLAGLPAAVSGTLCDPALTSLNRARKERLEPLSVGEVDAYLARAFVEMGVSIDPALRRRAAEATEGSPYLLQLVGHHVARCALDGAVTGATLDGSLASAAADYVHDVCETYLAASSRLTSPSSVRWPKTKVQATLPRWQTGSA